MTSQIRGRTFPFRRQIWSSQQMSLNTWSTRIFSCVTSAGWRNETDSFSCQPRNGTDSAGRIVCAVQNKNMYANGTKEEFKAYVTDRGFRVVKHQVQLPVRIVPNRIFFKEVIMRVLRGRPVRWNQLCLAQLA